MSKETSQRAKAILQRFANENKYKNDWKIKFPTIKRRNCIIYKATSKTSNLAIALKIFVDNKLQPSDIFNILKSYYAKGKDGNLAFPKPLALFPEESALIIEWINSPRLKDLLRKKFLKNETRAKAIADSARWLAWFHSLSERTLKEYNGTDIIKKIEKAKIARLTQNKISVALPCAILHDDFTPSNIFIGHEIIGFDFLATRYGPITHDICRFLTYLETLRRRPSNQEKLSKYGCNEDDYKIFAAAYGRDMQNISTEDFCQLQKLEIMRRLASLSQQSTEKPMPKRKKIEIARLHKMAKP